MHSNNEGVVDAEVTSTATVSPLNKKDCSRPEPQLVNPWPSLEWNENGTAFRKWMNMQVLMSAAEQ